MKNTCLITLTLWFGTVCGKVYYINPLSDDYYTEEFCYEKEVYTGSYVGAGLSYLHRSNSAKISDDVGEKFIAQNEGEFNEREKVFIRQQAFSADNLNLNDRSYSKIGGSVNIGYGQFINGDLYLGIDFTLDISGNNKSVNTDRRGREEIEINGNEVVQVGTYKDTIIRNKEIIPTLAIRAGVYVPYINTLICTRLGASFINMEVENSTLKNKVKINRIAPIIGLSFEKSLYRNWSMKLEGDYVFSVKKKFGDTRSDTLIVGVPVYHSETVKTHGYVVRLMCVYHF